jgi:hypothetical protein
MSDQRYMMGTAGNDTRICAAGGYASPSFKNVIDFITPTTLGNAIDFGDLTGSRSDVGGTSNTTRGVFFAGAPGTSNVIDFIEFSTTGNAVDFGDLPTALKSPVGSSTSTNGYISGGGSGSYPADTPVNTISEITFGTLGNATDFGDLTVARITAAAVCDNTKSVIAGGSTASSQDSRNTSNVIDSFIMTTRGNATDFGDLTVARNTLGGACGGHGGIEKSQPRAPELYSPTGRPSGDIGYLGGGNQPSVSTAMSFYAISSTGNASNFGNLTLARSSADASGNAIRGIFAGGYTPTYFDTIDYINPQTKGNAADFGNLSITRYGVGAVSEGTKVAFLGGDNPSTDNRCDQVTIATLGNATDFGDTTASVMFQSGGHVNSSTRGIIMGGYTAPTYVNTIQYVTFSSLGDCTDFGDLTAARYDCAASSSATRGVAGGGHGSPDTKLNVIDYITISSTGNATDFGDLSQARSPGPSGISNKVRATFNGGITLSQVNTIDYITIASTGDAADFGDCVTVNSYMTGNSNGHGGLS